MKKHHTDEQILGILKEAELGKPLPELLCQHGITSGTFYRWKSRYGGLGRASWRGCGNWSERTTS